MRKSKRRTVFPQGSKVVRNRTQGNHAKRTIDKEGREPRIGKGTVLTFVSASRRSGKCLAPSSMEDTKVTLSERKVASLLS